MTLAYNEPRNFIIDLASDFKVNIKCLIKTTFDSFFGFLIAFPNNCVSKRKWESLISFTRFYVENINPVWYKLLIYGSSVPLKYRSFSCVVLAALRSKGGRIPHPTEIASEKRNRNMVMETSVSGLSVGCSQNSIPKGNYWRKTSY